MKKLFRAILIAAAVIPPRIAWALDPCEQDRPKVCWDVKPGKGAVHHCMMAHMSKLSEDCRTAVGNSEALISKFLMTCESGTRRFCNMEMELRPDTVVDCMRRNKAKYSAECKRIHSQIKAYNYPVLE